MSKVSRANFCKACGGTVMVEFAIILPLLLFLLLGITEIGRALYQQNMLTQAVELGGRYIARVEGAVNADCTEGAKWDVNFENMVANLIKCGVDGTAGCAKPVLPNIVIDYIEVCGPDNSHASCTSPSACVITVRATANFQSIFGEDEDLIVLPGKYDPEEPDDGFYRIGRIKLNAATQERYIGH